MDTKEVFTNLQELNLELRTLTIESDASVAALKNLCYNALREINNLKEESISQHVILSKNQAKEYINKGLVEIIKYNDTAKLRSIGNFEDVLKPIQAGLEIILNLDY